MTANIINSVLNRPETGGEQIDTARFNAVFMPEMKPLYRYARWLTGNAAVAEDLVQETLLRAWRAFGQLKESTSAKGWLLTILRRENARRFERKRPVESQFPVEAIPDDVPSYDTSTEAFALRRALEVSTVAMGARSHGATTSRVLVGVASPTIIGVKCCMMPP